MVTRSAPCDPARLKLLLEDRLSENEQEALSAHLEACESCRQALEQMAAETRWWSDVKELAAPDPDTLGNVRPGGIATETDASGHDPITIPNGFLAPVDDPESLGKLGPYDVSEIIGRGGNGLVLKALDPALRRLVAVKVLAPELATSAAARRRFAREARAAAAVTHEHVVAIHAVDTAPNGLPYLVMSYVPGKSLQERLDRGGPLEVGEILRIALQTASGLAAAHAQGLVHRDIKPANILLENGMERVKITDFGLARAADDASLSQSGVVAGTPQYMAPEQARGEMVDHRADLFSLGSVMYTMATGRPPFRADSTLAVLRRVCDDAPRPIREINPEIPQWLAEIVARLHEKDPAKRFRSATEVAELLGRCLAYLQNPTDRVPPYRREPAAPAAALRRWALPVAALALLGLGLGAAEATGVTRLFSTVLRIHTPDGIVVLNVEEPGVEVEIDGERVSLKGPGPNPIQLDAGTHRLRATKDGVPIKNEPITITQGDRRVVTIRVEPGERLKSQAEYVEGLVPKTVARPNDVVSTTSGAVNEVDALRERNKLLEDQVRRFRERNEAGNERGPARARVGFASATPSSTAAPVATTRSNLAGANDLAPATGLEAAPALERLAPLPEYSATLAKLGEPATALDTSADGQTLAVASGASVRVWGLRAPSTAPRVLQSASGRVISIALSADGKRLAIGGADGTILIRALPDGDADTVVKDLGGRIMSMAFAPDRDVLAVAIDGGQVKLVETRSGGMVRELPKQPQPVIVVRYSRDGKQLATAGGSDDLTQPGLVTVWDPNTGKLKAGFDGLRPIITALAFSPDGATLALGDTLPHGATGSHIQLWDIATRQQTGAYYMDAAVQAVAFSPDGDTVAAATKSGYVHVYRIQDRQAPTIASLQAHSGAVTGLGFGPDGESLVTAGKDGAVTHWTLTTVTVSPRQAISLGEPLATFHDGMGQRIWSAAFAPDGKTLAATYSVNVTEDDELTDGQGGLALWDPAAGNLRNTILAPHVIRGVAFAPPDGKTLATAEYDKAVCLRDAGDGRVLKRFPVSDKGASAVSFSHDGRWLAAAGLDGLAYVWEVATAREAARLKADDDALYTVAFSPDGKFLAAAGTFTDVVIWNLATGKIHRTLEGHEAEVEHVAFTPDGLWLASASRDQTVKLWRTSSERAARTLRGHQLPVLGLAFSSDSRYLATCAATWGVTAGPGTGELILWDLPNRKALTPTLSYPHRVLGVAFSPNPKTFATAAWDGAVRLWNVDALSTRTVSVPTLPQSPVLPSPAVR